MANAGIKTPKAETSWVLQQLWQFSGFAAAACFAIAGLVVASDVDVAPGIALIVASPFMALGPYTVSKFLQRADETRLLLQQIAIAAAKP